MMKKILHCLGGLFSLVGLIFVFFELKKHGDVFSFSLIPRELWFFLVGFIVVYGVASSFLFSLAWWQLLRWLHSKVPFSWAFHVYGLSQLAKYAPGNIFHLAGRQMMGMSHGIHHKKLLKSIAWELGLSALSASLCFSLMLPRLMLLTVQQSLCIYLFLLFIVVSLLRFFLGWRVLIPFFSNLSLQLLSGFIFLALILCLPSAHVFLFQDFVLILGAYIVAWLIGFVTPGSPAGVGVREVVLLFLLKNIVPDNDLLLVVILSRLVTMGGDVLFFIFALGVSLIPKNNKYSKAQ